MIIGKKFKFESAHSLPEYDGKCANLHGHTYILEVEVWGQKDLSGMVIDLNKLTELVKPVIDIYDHQLLNTLMDNPTVENLVSRIKELLELQLNNGVRLQSIKLQEGEGGWARWESR